MDPVVKIMTWMAVILVGPGILLLIGKVVISKVKGRSFSADWLTISILYAVLLVAIIDMNIESSRWGSRGLIVIQVCLLYVLYKRIWPSIKRSFQ